MKAPARAALAVMLVGATVPRPLGATVPRSLGAAAFQCPDGSPPPCDRVTRDSNVVVVTPLRYQGVPDAAWLGGDGAADVLRVALDGAGGWRVVPPAHRARAATAIEGQVFVLGRESRVVVRVLDLRTGRVVREFQRRGALADVASVLDSVAADLVLARLQQRGATFRRSAAEYATASTPALRAYVAAEAAMRAGRMQEAADSLLRALAEDSAFGLAWYRLYVAATYGAAIGPHASGNFGTIARAGLRYQRRFTDRQRAVLGVVAAMNEGDRAAALARAEELERLWPDDADALFTAAEARYHVGLGPVWFERALRGFDAALARDSAIIEAYLHVVGLRAANGDTATAWAALRAARRRAPGLRLLASVDVAMRVGLRDELAAWPTESLFASEAAGRAVLYRAADEEVMRLLDAQPARALSAAERIYLVMADSRRERFTRLIAYAELAVLAVARGRYRYAWELLTSQREVLPEHRSVEEFPVLLAARTGTRLSETRVSLDALRRRDLDTVPGAAALEGWFAFAAGDTAGLARAAERVRGARGALVDSALAAGLRAWLALCRGDSAGARRGLRQGLEVRTYGWDPGGPERAMALTLARLDLAVGDHAGVDQALELMYLGRDGALYRAEAEEIRAASLLARGDTAGGRRALATFVSLWAGADPELQPRVAAARRTLAELGRP